MVMKIKAVIEIEVPEGLVQGCKEENRLAYDEVYDFLVDQLQFADTLDDYGTIISQTAIRDYKFFDETCQLLFEMQL